MDRTDKDAIQSKHMTRFRELIAPLRTVNWAALEDVSSLLEATLRSLTAQPAMVGALFSSAEHDPSLAALCEHYDLLDRIVFHNDQQFRLRLHVFHPGYFDRPHSHRWSYSSLILAGRYRHLLYGQDDNLADTVDVSSLEPMMIGEAPTGSFYILHHSAIHSRRITPNDRAAHEGALCCHGSRQQ